MKTGVLLVNLGTPNSPSVADVRQYLREFLMDQRVMDIPLINRFFLVNGLIAPFRAVSSAKAYQKLWTNEGSPLKTYGYEVIRLLQDILGKDYVVSLAMRYQNPTIQEGLAKLKEAHVEKIVILPLYPQYASASTGSTHAAVMDELARWEVIPETKFISKFCNHPGFIHAFAEIGQKYLAKKTYDHVIFSYHGLPERQIHKASRNHYCRLNDSCCRKYNRLNEYCYRAQCFETSRLLAEKLKLPAQQYTISFQSRLGRTPWIKPYTDDVLKTLAAKGVKNLLVFSPAFVADCLETTVEIGMEYQELFRALGGESLTLVESLNRHQAWISCLRSLVCEPTGSQEPVLI